MPKDRTHIPLHRCLGAARASLFAVCAALLGCGTGEDDPAPEDTGDENDTSDAGDYVDTQDSASESEEDTGGGFTCVPKMNELARVEIPSPRISVGATIVSGDGVSNAAKLVDGRYHSGDGAIFDSPGEDAPPWVSIELGSGPTRLLAIWSDVGWTDYDNLSGGAPLGYRILTSADSIDGEDGTWHEVVSVSDNPVRSRGHSFPFDGASWVRLEVTAAQEGETSVEIDELAIHDISASGDERPQDTWFIIGDSITKMAFERASGLQPFDVTLADMLDDDFYPALISGGVGSVYSSFGLENIEEWLALNPDFTHIGIAYGTNDSWGDKSVGGSGFDGNMRELVLKILDAGRVPHLASIPFSSDGEHETVPEFNAFIEELIEEYELPCGPDMYTWFKENDDELGNDLVHPSNPTGLASVNRLWAESALPLYVTD